MSELTHLVDNFLNLTGKFSGRSDTDGLKISVSRGYKAKEPEKKTHLRGGDGRIDSAQHVEGKGSSLTSTGLTLSDEVSRTKAND